MNLIYIYITIFLTVYSQLIIKWKMAGIGPLPEILMQRIIFLMQLFLNPWILSVIVASVLALLSWMTAMTKLPLSYAYPYTTLSLVMVMIFGICVFNEQFTWYKFFGSALIIMGVFVISQTSSAN